MFLSLTFRVQKQWTPRHGSFPRNLKLEQRKGHCQNGGLVSWKRTAHSSNNCLSTLQDDSEVKRCWAGVGRTTPCPGLLCGVGVCECVWVCVYTLKPMAPYLKI